MNDQDGWREIDDDARDGREILAWDRIWGFAVARYEPAYGEIEPRWAVGEGLVFYERAFTHWRPLPRPPLSALDS